MAGQEKMFTEKQEEVMSQTLFDLLFNIGNYMGVSEKVTDQYIDEAVTKYMRTVNEGVKLQTAFENVRKDESKDEKN